MMNAALRGKPDAGNPSARLLVGVLVGLALAVGVEARTVHSLDGEGWTLDGAPVTVPHTWNAVDGADGRSDGQNPSVMHDFFEGNSLSAQSYVRKMATYGRSLPSP